jgi:hypothetical protein
MSNKPRLLIRFSLNRKSGGQSAERFRSQGRSFAHTVVTEVGEIAADKSYNDMKTKLRNDIHDVVFRELEHLAILYSKFIIGRERLNFQGKLTTTSNNGESDIRGNPTPTQSSGMSVLGGRWAPRKKRYLRDKERRFGHTRWFEGAGRLREAIKTSAWTSWFGPIQTKVFREKEKRDIGNGKMRFAVAKLEVRVFGSITPSMLPALMSGNPSDIGTADGRSSGLIGLVHKKEPGTAYHLAGGRSRNVPYRPTLEPFLAFAITRSVPTAVFEKLKGVTGARSSAGNVGRARPSR